MHSIQRSVIFWCWLQVLGTAQQSITTVDQLSTDVQWTIEWNLIDDGFCNMNAIPIIDHWEVSLIQDWPLYLPLSVTNNPHHWSVLNIAKYQITCINMYQPPASTIVDHSWYFKQLPGHPQHQLSAWSYSEWPGKTGRPRKSSAQMQPKPRWPGTKRHEKHGDSKIHPSLSPLRLLHLLLLVLSSTTSKPQAQPVGG